MSISYDIRIDGDVRFATFSADDGYFEVPIGATDTEADLQEKFNKILHNTRWNKAWGERKNKNMAQLRDDIYCNGQRVRQDFTVGLSEGSALVTKLQQAFPDEHDWDRSESNLVGEHGSYRLPYENETISWYDYNVKPSNTLLTKYNAVYSSDDLNTWYGLKFDMTTKKVMLKVVLNKVDFDVPEFPEGFGKVGETFYAVTYSSDGTASDWVDAYVYGSRNIVKKFCADKSLTYPFPDDFDFDGKTPWVWGFVFKKSTKEYGPVKAYLRTYFR